MPSAVGTAPHCGAGGPLGPHPPDARRPRVPHRRRSIPPADPAGRSVWFGPAGALIGAVLGALWWGATNVWPAPVAAAIVVAADLAVTGLLHVDGLADSADGLLPHLDRERRLAVMATPDVGAFGVAVVAVVLLLRVGGAGVDRPAGLEGHRLPRRVLVRRPAPDGRDDDRRPLRPRRPAWPARSSAARRWRRSLAAVPFLALAVVRGASAASWRWPAGSWPPALRRGARPAPPRRLHRRRAGRRRRGERDRRPRGDERPMVSGDRPAGRGRRHRRRPRSSASRRRASTRWPPSAG